MAARQKPSAAAPGVAEAIGYAEAVVAGQVPTTTSGARAQA